MEWSDLRIFLAIARAGTLGAAARGIGQSQPTMGRRLRALETAVGHTLFQRTGDGFVLETSYDSVDDGVPHYTRSVNVVTVRDGRISKVVHYCTGPWDPATRAQHAMLTVP